MEIVIEARDKTYLLSELERFEIDMELGIVSIIEGGFCTRYKLDEVKIKVVEQHGLP